MGLLFRGTIIPGLLFRGLQAGGRGDFLAEAKVTVVDFRFQMSFSKYNLES